MKQQNKKINLWFSLVIIGFLTIVILSKILPTTPPPIPVKDKIEINFSSSDIKKIFTSTKLKINTTDIKEMVALSLQKPIFIVGNNILEESDCGANDIDPENYQLPNGNQVKLMLAGIVALTAYSVATDSEIKMPLSCIETQAEYGKYFKEYEKFLEITNNIKVRIEDIVVEKDKRGFLMSIFGDKEWLNIKIYFKINNYDAVISYERTLPDGEKSDITFAIMP